MWRELRNANIETEFRFDYEWDAEQQKVDDVTVIGLLASPVSSVAISPGAGFHDFGRNIECSGHVSVTNGIFTGAREFGWLSRDNGLITSRGSVVRAVPGLGKSVAAQWGGEVVTRQTGVEGEPDDFRCTEGVNSPDDISVFIGGKIALHTSTLGGTSIPSNEFRRDGAILRQGASLSTFSRSNLLGTVSQSAGVPTGAAIQRDSNSDGSYTRFADGTQICWRRITRSLAIDTSYQGGFRSVGQSDPFPVSFSASPEATVTPVNDTSFGAYRRLATASNVWGWAVTSVTTQTSAERIVSLEATGRWF
jgi:hypothetical protein